MDELARWTAVASPWVADETDASEPELTDHERNEIAAKAARSASITSVAKGGYQADKAQEYVGTGGVVKPKSWLSRMTLDEYGLALTYPQSWTPPTGTASWSFRNLAWQSEAKGWQLSRISSEYCILAHVDIAKLDADLREKRSNPAHRALGIDYARIGLPRVDWEYVFESLEATEPACISSGYTKPAGLGAITKTASYYWVDVTWGTRFEKAYFTIQSASDSRDAKKYTLEQAVRALQGRSARGLMNASMALGRCAGQPWSLSVKCHSFIAEIQDVHPGPSVISAPTKVSRFSRVKKVGETKDEVEARQEEEKKVSMDQSSSALTASNEASGSGERKRQRSSSVSGVKDEESSTKLEAESQQSSSSNSKRTRLGSSSQTELP